MSPKVDGQEEQCVPARQSSTRSCDYPTRNAPNRTEVVRRSLKELRLDVGRNLDSLVNRPRLERISESEGTHTEKRPSIFERLQKTIDDLPNLPNVGGEGSVVERIDNTLNDHYYTIAYGVVIVAYMIGFAEYLYLRLVSIIIPDKMIYHKTCMERANETVGKDGFHYGVSIAAFLVIAMFQLICFFGLTISEKWTKQSHFGPASAASLRREQLASSIRRVISSTMYRTFLCYGICSGIICMIIFYMIGIQDSVDETASTICGYIFDVVVLLYFCAFPLTTVIYHPHVYCFKKRRPRASPDGNDKYTNSGVAQLVNNNSLSQICHPQLQNAEIAGCGSSNSVVTVPNPSTVPIPPLPLSEGSSSPSSLQYVDINRHPPSASFYKEHPETRVQTVRDPPLLSRDAGKVTPEHFKRGMRITTTV